MALLAMHSQAAAEGASTTIFDDVAEFIRTSGFAHQTPVDFLTSGLEVFDNFYCAVFGWAFFITGDKISNAALMIGMLLDKAFAGGEHGGQ